MGIRKVNETRRGHFAIDRKGTEHDVIALLYYELKDNGEYSATLEVYKHFDCEGEEIYDTDDHRFENGDYRYSELGYSSSQAILGETVEVASPFIPDGMPILFERLRGKPQPYDKYADFKRLRVKIKDFHIDDEVREALSDIPEDHLARKLIGEYL